MTIFTSLARHHLAMKTFVILLIAATVPQEIVKPIAADINSDMLQQHNDYRAAHNADPLSIDPDVS